MEDREPGRLGVCKQTVGSGVPQPPLAVSGQPQVPSYPGPTAEATGGLWKSPVHPLPGKFSRVTLVPPRLHLRPSGAKGRRVSERVGRRAGIPTPPGADQPGLARGIPAERRLPAGGKGGGDGVSQSPGSRQLGSSAESFSSPRPPPGDSEAGSAVGHPSRRPSWPGPHPGPAHPDPRLRPPRLGKLDELC